MNPFWSSSVDAFLHTPDHAVIGCLAAAQLRHYRTNELQQLRAWEGSLALLRLALRRQRSTDGWWLLLEYPLLRLGRRADAILLLPRMIVVLEFKIGAHSYLPADRLQVEDYAIDLRDFHAASRAHPIMPVVVASEAPAPLAATRSLPIPGVAQVLDANAASLPGLIAELAATEAAVASPLDARMWCAASYRPVPGIIEAACMLYARHGVEEIRAARADTENLTATTDAILRAISAARAEQRRICLFVTGIPGAGKTLCGLNAAFGTDEAARATFLTGNPTLVHVLREALARDAIAAGGNARVARQKMEGVIQALPKFRDHYVSRPEEAPAERIVVIDEAQRCWSAAYACAKTRDKPVPLSLSEPAHLLEIMGRHEGFAAMVCLVGGGQEIHDGEGGLAEWGEALRAGAGWAVLAAPDTVQAQDARQRLGNVEGSRVIPALHLQIPVRQIRFAGASAWTDAVLRGDAGTARRIAAEASGALPYAVTRSVAAMRHWLRAACRGHRRAGLLASSGARRLRAEGLGVELPHMDAKAVAHWFLDRYPEDVRASGALEVVATEFCCQGLELDFCGVCWDADLIRDPGTRSWRVRAFRGKDWQKVAKAEDVANQINTYRVLLTRARYETVIYVPLGDVADRTRDPKVYAGITDFLMLCGARELSAPAEAEDAPAEALALLV